QSKETLLKKELNSIDWNDVDEYPSIANCDVLETKAQQRQCFFEYLKANVQKKLDSVLNSKPSKEVDSLNIEISILPNSQVVYDYNDADLEIKSEINLDSVFLLETFQFKKLEPALKRGIPVKIQFEIPVMIGLK
ncbi:MAG: hypothetical protein RLZZ312_2029, partial [Bacteroidota bacterium]